MYTQAQQIMDPKYPASHVLNMNTQEFRPQEQWDPVELEAEVGDRSHGRTARPIIPITEQPSTNPEMSANTNLTPKEIETLKQMQYWANIRREQQEARNLVELERRQGLTGELLMCC